LPTSLAANRSVDPAPVGTVLLDARLPGVSGGEACRRLVASHPDVAVLIVSTYSDDQLIEECIKAGAKGYIIKDIERFSLKESIRAVHGGGGAVSPAIAAKVLGQLRSTENTPAPQPSIPSVTHSSRSFDSSPVATRIARSQTEFT
jgi:DNA-binding NarL/FixJ family response regulator